MDDNSNSVAADTGSPFDLFSLAGKVALVTGGSRGMGRQMALAFAKAGADVVVASRKLENCQSVVAEIEAIGRQGLAYSCHLGHWGEIEGLVDAATGSLRPMGSIIPYAAAKNGLNAMTEGFADLLGPEVRVNTLMPG
eukprot:gene27106-32651_t